MKPIYIIKRTATNRVNILRLDRVLGARKIATKPTMKAAHAFLGRLVNPVPREERRARAERKAARKEHNAAT